MPYDRVLELAKVYDDQRSYADQSHEVEQLIFAKLFNEGFDAMLRNHANLLTVISTFWFRECRLLREYDATFERIGPTPANAGSSGPTLPEMCQHVPPG